LIADSSHASVFKWLIPQTKLKLIVLFYLELQNTNNITNREISSIDFIAEIYWALCGCSGMPILFLHTHESHITDMQHE